MQDAGEVAKSILSLLIVGGIIALVVWSKMKRAAKIKEFGLFGAGRYMYGHPALDSPRPTNAFIRGDELVFTTTGMYKTIAEFPVYFTIPIKAVTEASIENASTIEKRITATRLLTIGVFALAAKKKYQE
jgi:uncharacterized sodium:solute symporter family permease YidK